MKYLQLTFWYKCISYISRDHNLMIIDIDPCFVYTVEAEMRASYIFWGDHCSICTCCTFVFNKLKV